MSDQQHPDGNIRRQMVHPGCLSVVLNVTEHDNLITVGTHLSPDSGCTFVLDARLSLVGDLLGWELGYLGRHTFFERNMVHFAPVHPASLAVYDPDLRRTRAVYPLVNDKARERFSATLARHLPSRQFCMQENLPCDVKSFETDIDQVKVNQACSTISFGVTMSAVGFGPAAKAAVPDQAVHYTCYVGTHTIQCKA